MGPVKASLEGVVRQLAVELGPHGITANAISAPPMQTLAARGIRNFSALQQQVEERKSMQQTDAGADVGALSTFLAGGGGAGVTGQVLHGDGGFSTRL